MTKIAIAYENGATWVCEVDPCGSADAGDICAAASAIYLDENGLVFEPSVMGWGNGIWRLPEGIVNEYSRTSRDYFEVGGKRTELVDGSSRSIRHIDRASYRHQRFLLRSSADLEGATSITVDGTLAYANEGRGLLAIGSGFQEVSMGGMESQFATANRPVSPFDALQAETTSNYEPKGWSL